MTKRLIILLASLVLVVPFLFYGCSGDDGAAGAPGTNGTNGTNGNDAPGALAKETCGTCHGAGTAFSADKMHGLNTANRNTLKAGTATVTIDNVVLPAPTADGYVKARVDFTFKALDSNGHNITSQIDLRTTNTAGDNLALATFSIAKLVAGFSNEWNSFVLDPGAGGSGPYRTIAANGTKGAVFTGTPDNGVYSYTFADNVLRVADGYVDNVVYRVTVQASGFDVTLFTSDPVLQTNDRRAVANAYRDQVGSIAGAAVTFPVPAGYPTKNDVTTAACNQCHDPIGFHSQSARRETTYCVVCHNPRSETVGNPAGGGFDNVSLINMVHGIHSKANIGEFGDFTDITYPQRIQNCTTCHQGSDDFWKTRPSRYSCGSCHVHAPTFSASGSHATRLDAGCTTCHNPTGGTVTDNPKSTTVAHALDNNLTPGNVPPGQDNIVYFIDNVTVDNNYPVVTFRVTQNGTPIVFNKYAGPDNNVQKKAFVDNGLITGYTGSPSFLVAFAANQDGISPVVDYNNLGNNHIQGQAATVTVSEIFLNDNNSGTIVSGPDGSGNYKVKLLKDVTRSSSTGAITTDNSVQYPAGASMRAVGLQGRLVQLISGVGKRRYVPSAVKNVTGDTVRRQVVDSNSCLDCHKILAIHGGNRVNNVQLCVMCHNPNLGEGGGESFNLKDFVHGLHRASTAYPGFEEVTYPGALKHCTKCHIGTTYKADLPAGVLMTTNSVMGIAPASTDNVVSPTAAACGRCHNASTSQDHFRLMGGDVGSTRAVATVTAPVTVMSADLTP